MTNSSFLPSTNFSQLDCPRFTEQDQHLISQFHIWIEGVTQTCVAIPGFLGNVFFCYILTRRDLMSSFNLLLVALSIFDSCYILGAMLESIRKEEIFNMSTSLHVHLFPYLLYPGSNIAMTASIFMIVAITFERYIAVHNPLDYNQAMNDENAIRTRLLKYLLPVVIASIAFNIPKFFESKVSYVPVNVTEMENGINVTHVYNQSFVDVTWFRTHPHYQTYLNWSQSLVLGFIPVALLIYYNGRIYMDIRERERRKRPKKRELSQIGTNKNCPQTTMDGGNKGSKNITVIETISKISKAEDDESKPLNNKLEHEAVGKHNCSTSSGNAVSDNATTSNEANKSLRVKRNEEKNALSSNGKENGEFTQENLMSTCLEKEKEHLLKSASIVRIKDNGSSNQKNVITKTEISPNNRPKGIPITSPTTTVTNQNKSNNAKRRKAEDKMAMIFIAIVTGWLITNFPRICLNFQEVLNVNKQQECMKQRPHSLPFPPWTLMLDPFSHLLLVINSALNIIFYGIFNKKFREVAKKEFIRCFPKTAARLSPSKSKRIATITNQNHHHGNQNNKHGLPEMETGVTELTRLTSTRNCTKESFPLRNMKSELPVNSSVSSAKNIADGKNAFLGPDDSSTVSKVNANNKTLMDSSTQIPNSEYTTNLKRIPTKEKSNNDNNGTIEDADPSKENSIIPTSQISKKESVNEECMNIEAGTNNKFANTTDIDGITKFSDTSIQHSTKERDNKNELSRMEFSQCNDDTPAKEVVQKRDTPQIYV